MVACKARTYIIITGQAADSFVSKAHIRQKNMKSLENSSLFNWNRFFLITRVAGAGVLILGATAIALVAASPGSFTFGRPTAKTPALFHPAVAEWQFLGSSTTPPSEADCFAAGRRCFTPSAMENAYNVTPLYG